MAINYDFIRQLEGDRRDAYIPKEASGRIIGQSGVTIGAGLDLGNFGDLSVLGLPKSLENKLDTYVGMRRDIAEQVLKDNPLELSAEEAATVNRAVFDYQQERVKRLYEEESGKPWDTVPPEAQTVISSVLHQYGSPSRVPKFWSHATSNNWRGMVEELRDFGDSYSTRRNKEADYLESSMVTETNKTNNTKTGNNPNRQEYDNLLAFTVTTLDNLSSLRKKMLSNRSDRMMKELERAQAESVGEQFIQEQQEEQGQVVQDPEFPSFYNQG